MDSNKRTLGESITLRACILALFLLIYRLFFCLFNALLVSENPDFLYDGFGVGGFEGNVFLLLAFIVNPILARKERRFWASVIISGLTVLATAVFAGLTVYSWKSGAMPATAAGVRLYALGGLLGLVAVFAVILALCRIRPFSLGEMLVVFVVPSLALVLTSNAMTASLMPQISRAVYQADAANRWGTMTDEMPARLKPDLENYPNAAENFAIGAQQGPLFTDSLKPNLPWGEMWGAWSGMLAVWSIYFALLVLICFCVASIMRKQFIEKELMDYPLLRPSLEFIKKLTPGKGENALVGGKIFWTAFVIAIIMSNMQTGDRSLPYWAGKAPVIGPVIGPFFDGMPKLQFYHYGGSWFSNKPWNLLNRTIFRFDPGRIFLFYLIPMQASFSLWFFYLLTNKILPIIGTVMGYTIKQAGSNVGFEYVKDQSKGSILTVAILSLWAARRHLRDVFAKAFTGNKEIDDSNEFSSYRFAVFGLIFGFIALVWWCVWNNMSWYYAAIIFGIYITMTIFFGKLLGEMTLPVAHPDFLPQEYAYTIVGKSRVADHNIAVGGMVQNAHMFRQFHLMANMLMGFKLIGMSKINRRHVSWLLLAAFIVTIPLCHFVMLSTCYWVGIETHLTHMHNNALERQSTKTVEAIESTDTTQGAGIAQMGVGAALTGFFMFMRTRFLWWPFHPLAYAASSSQWLFQVWFSFFLAWCLKFTVVSIGGAAAYRNSLKVVFGYLVGSGVTGALWMFVRLIYNIREAPWN